MHNKNQYNKTNMNADDLDDGLDYDFADGVESGEVIVESSSQDTNVSDKETSKKRSVEESLSSSSSSATPDDEHLSKRQKKLQKSKFHLKKLEKMEFDKKQRLLLSTMDTEQIVEQLNQMVVKWYPDLSPLELEELYFKKTEFISTSDVPTKDRVLEKFPDFLTKFSKTPRKLIFCASNIRVANFSTTCKKKDPESFPLKLFSKNKLKDDLVKLQEYEDFAKANKNKSKTDIEYFVATPNRMEKILNETDFFTRGKEKLDIIIDSSYLDPKTDTIFTSIDGKIMCSVLKQILKNKSSVKILLF